MLCGVSTCRSRAWRDGAEVAEDFPLADLDHWLAQPSTLVWLDLQEPEPDVLDALAEELGLDPLAVEDAVSPRERPKASWHANHVFLTCYSTRLAAPADGGAQQPAAPQLAVSQVFVKVGRRSGRQVEILENLKAGDEIVSAGQNRLSNGTPVTVDNTVTPDQAATKAPAQ